MVRLPSANDGLGRHHLVDLAFVLLEAEREDREAERSADLLLIVDAARLWTAQSLGFFQPVRSKVLEERIPASLRDPDGNFYVKPEPGASDASCYAKHYLLAYACGAPFVQVRRMVEGPSLADSRGVAEMLRSLGLE